MKAVLFDLERVDSEVVEVLSGFEQGLGEAAEILEALSVLDESLSSSIDETAEIVRSGLSEWFEETSHSYRQAA